MHVQRPSGRAGDVQNTRGMAYMPTVRGNHTAMNLSQKYDGKRGMCPLCSYPIVCRETNDGRLSWRNPADDSAHFPRVNGTIICSTKRGLPG